MIERCFIHVTGPAQSGKTTFVETLLRGLKPGAICIRAARDDTLQAAEERPDEALEELRRYRRAGAWSVASYRFPGLERDDLGFFETRAMRQYSESVIFEGDLPVSEADLCVFVAPVLLAGTAFVRRELVDADAERATFLASWLRNLEDPEAFARSVSRGFPGLTDKRGETVRRELQQRRARIGELLAKAEPEGPPRLVERWKLAASFHGIEPAGLVVVNIREDGERARATELLEEIARLRSDDDVYHDIVRLRGSRKAITAVAASVANPADPGVKKALARVRRALARKRHTPPHGAT